MRLRLLILALLLLPFPAQAGEEMDVLCIEKPPYYSSDSRGRIKGFLVDRAEKLFRQAGITPRLRSASSAQVLEAMRAPEPSCSLGWFKTPERERFARFTLPIHTDHPLELLARASDAPLFQGLSTLAEVAASGRFVPGRIAGHSNGETVDAILAPLDSRTVFIQAEEAQLFRMLREGRFDFILTAPEETGHTLALLGMSPDDFLVLPLSDVPRGNTRHIMCSRSVPPEVIRRLDTAISDFRPAR